MAVHDGRNTHENARTLMEAGWHVLYGGDELRGAEMLESAATGLAHSGDPLHGTVPALEAALRVYERERRSPEAILRIRTSLVNASYFADRRLAARYGQETLRMLLAHSGMAFAGRLKPVLGRRIALIISVLLVALIRPLTPRTRRGPGARDGIAMLFRAGQALAAGATYVLDKLAIRSVVDQLALFSDAPEGRPGHLIYNHCLRLLHLTQGREYESYELNEKLLADVRDPRKLTDFTPELRRRTECGMLFSLGVLEAFRGTPAAERVADELDGLGATFFSLVSEQIRMLSRAHRGQMDAADLHRKRFEVATIQVGAAWQSEVWTPAAMALAYLNTHDVIGLKRCLEALKSLEDEVPSLNTYRRMLFGAYLRLQGKVQESVEYMSDMLPEIRPREHVGWARFHAGLAESLNLLGEHTRARDVCLNALGHCRSEDRMFPALYLTLELELALAQAKLGERDAAVSRLEDLLGYYAKANNPLMHGLLHRARASVACACRDRVGVDVHLSEMERWFRTTGNPSLIAHGARFAAKTRADLEAPVSVLGATAGAPVDDVVTQATLRLGRGTSSVGRIQEALDVLVEAVSGDWGLLFVHDQGHVRAIASTGTPKPSEALHERLAEYFDRHELDADTATDDGAEAVDTPDDDCLVGLVAQEGEHERLVAVVATNGCRLISLELVRIVAEAIRQSLSSVA